MKAALCAPFSFVAKLQSSSSSFAFMKPSNTPSEYKGSAETAVGAALSENVNSGHCGTDLLVQTARQTTTSPTAASRLQGNRGQCPSSLGQSPPWASPSWTLWDNKHSPLSYIAKGGGNSN